MIVGGKILSKTTTAILNYCRSFLKFIKKKITAIKYFKEIVIVFLFFIMLLLLSNYIKFTFAIYALYISVGVLSSQFYNIYIYKRLGAKDLMTWFKSFGITSRLPSIRFIVDICLIYFILLFFLISYYLNKAILLNNIELLQIGFMISVIICFISQLIFSSVMRFMYELSFCVLVLFALLISNMFLNVPLNNYVFVQESYKELWDLLIFILPICIGFPIVIGGTGFITSFYAKEKSILRKQLYRHVLMSTYFEFGAVYLIIIPILSEMIVMKEFLTTA